MYKIYNKFLPMFLVLLGMDAIRYLRISYIFITSMLFLITCSIAHADVQFVRLSQQEDVDIGQSGWQYVAPEPTASYEARNIHPSFRNILDFVPSQESIANNYATYSKIIRYTQSWWIRNSLYIFHIRIVLTRS